LYAENLEEVLERRAHVDMLGSALAPELCLLRWGDGSRPLEASVLRLPIEEICRSNAEPVRTAPRVGF